MNILVVEDEMVISNGIRMILQAEGHSVKVFNDAESAIEHIGHGRCGLAIIDYILPKIDGISLIAKFKEKCPNLPVIMISGFDTADTVIAGVRAGVFDYLPKPFTRQELISRVERAVRFAAGKNYTVPRKPKRCRFGSFSWVKMKEAIAEIGIDPCYIATIPHIKAIYGPETGQRLYQGGKFAEIVTRKDVIFPVWSPVSGSVVESMISREGIFNVIDIRSDLTVAKVQVNNFLKDRNNLNSGKGVCA